MSNREKSATIDRFLDSKAQTRKRSVSPLKSNNKQTKVQTTQDSNIVIELPGGDQYKGKIDADMQVTGCGQLNLEDSKLGTLEYQGNFNKNRIDGFGELNIDDVKISYKGNFSNNKIEGIGRFNSGEYLYYGQWISNKFNGYGRIIKRNFALYEGLFVKDDRDGYGVEIYQNSDVYIGEFKKDLRSGIGTYFFFDGGFYFGFFKDNKRDGFGTLYNKRNMLIYKGYWKEDKKDGRGMEFYKNESKYNGYFKHNMRNGIGFMEYSKSLLYMGEWKDNKKHGSGKLDVGKKSVMGKFHNDEIVDNCFVDASKFADKINNNKLEESMEEYLKTINYNVKEVFLRGLHDLYKILKEPLVDFVLKLIDMGVLRLKVYILLKNLFSKGTFENILEDIKIFLKYEPNMYYLLSLWDTSIAEILRDKDDYRWNLWVINESQKEMIFSERESEPENRIRGKSVKNNKAYVFDIKKTEETLQLIITNRVAKGENADYNFEGVLNNRGFELRYYSKETGDWLRNVEYTVYPYFITMTDGDTGYMISTKLFMYSGEFFFYNDNSHPLNIIMFLNFDHNENIYTVGLDAVGTFVVAGEFDKQKSTGKFIQKYFQDYKIEYEAFLFTEDKIQGYWSTTNISGHFILRKNHGFKFSREVAALMEIAIREQDKLQDKLDITKLSELELLLNSGIVPVLVSGRQGGIPEFGQPKKEEEDLSLFEKYKKKNEEDNYHKSTAVKKRTSMQRAKVDSKASQDNRNQLLSNATKDDNANYAKKDTAAEGKVDENQKLHESEEIIQKMMSQDDDPFKRKLSKALKQLKQAESEKYSRWQTRFDPSSEDITWVGHRNILGKEEPFMIDNLYISGDRIEGYYIDEKGVNYELAGSYSTRTKDFEIIGMTQDKTKSIKFKGEFKDFHLKGTFMNRSYNGPKESFEVKMFGYEAKCDVSINKDNQIGDLPCILKISDKYLYAIVSFEKTYIFLNGYKNRFNVFHIDVDSMSKRLKSCSMAQVADQEEVNNTKASDLLEKRLVFGSELVNIIIRY